PLSIDNQREKIVEQWRIRDKERASGDPPFSRICLRLLPQGRASPSEGLNTQLYTDAIAYL
ncbi:hypothetical protein A2U01_0085206, partial [Trifolium medium]|nr:hypothetical protein [Trifolium medium]